MSDKRRFEQSNSIPAGDRRTLYRTHGKCPRNVKTGLEKKSFSKNSSGTETGRERLCRLIPKPGCESCTNFDKGALYALLVSQLMVVRVLCALLALVSMFIYINYQYLPE